LLPLGRPPLPWQAVGYLEACDIPAPGDDEETSFWREYLLFNTTQGFAFLVDTNDGWSWVKPLTGVPVVKGDKAIWQGRDYRKRWSYSAKVTWVQGEFYWRLQRDERALVIDYEGSGAHAQGRLSREQTGLEVTWSGGETLAAEVVAEAFGIAPAQRAALQRDAAPISSGAGVAKALVILAAVLILVLMLSRCGADGCDQVRDTFGAASNEFQQCQRSNSGSGVRTGGGSYGGWSSGGGGHK